MRLGLFHLREEENTQNKNYNFTRFNLKSGDTEINLLDLFGTDGLMMDKKKKKIQIIKSVRYASTNYGGYKLDRNQRRLNGRTSENFSNSFFEDLKGNTICDDNNNVIFTILGLKYASFNDRHVILLLHPNDEPWDTFERFEAVLGANARGLTEEKQAASKINQIFKSKNCLAAYPNGDSSGNFSEIDSLSDIEPGLSEGQIKSFQDWFEGIPNKNKSYRCFMRKDLIGFEKFFKTKSKYIDSFTTADFFIFSDSFISEAQGYNEENTISVSKLNEAVKKGDLFPISYKNSTKTNCISFISNGKDYSIWNPNVVNVYSRKLAPLENENTKTYAKLWVSGVSTFENGTYTINTVLNIYDVPENDLSKKHFLVGVQLRSAGDTKCIAETSLKAYTKSSNSNEIIEVDSDGQGGKITSLLPMGDTGIGKVLVKEYFNLAWAKDKEFKTKGKKVTPRIIAIEKISFADKNTYAFNDEKNYSAKKIFGLIDYLRDKITGDPSYKESNNRSDFFFEVNRKKVLSLLKIVYRIRDPEKNKNGEIVDDGSLNYYKWENRKRHRLSLNEKIKIAEVKVKIAERNLKSKLAYLRECTSFNI